MNFVKLDIDNIEYIEPDLVSYNWIKQMKSVEVDITNVVKYFL